MCDGRSFEPCREKDTPPGTSSDSEPSESASLSSLGKKTAGASFVVLVSQLISICLRFVGVGILARMLTAEDFGAAAIVLYVVGSVGQMRMAGLQQFLVRTRDPKRIVEGTVNTLNVGLGALTCLVLLVTSTWLANLCGSTPGLRSVFHLGAFYAFFVGLDALPKARLMRDMRFTRVMVVQVVFTVLIPYGIAIGLARAGHLGPKTAFAPVLLGMIFVPIALTAMDRRMPFSFSGPVAREALSFGLPLGLATLLSMLLARCEVFFLSTLSTLEAVGLYTMSMQLVRVPGHQFITMLSGVLTSAFSQVQTDLSGLRELYVRSLHILMLICGTLLVVMATSSSDIVALVYGPKFARCAPLVAILATGFLVRFPSSLVGPLLTAIGKTKTLALVNGALGVVQVLAFAAAATMGLTFVCAAVLAVGLFTSIVWLIVLRRFIALPLGSFARRSARILLILSLTYLAAMCVSPLLPAGGAVSVSVLRIGIRGLAACAAASALIPLLVPDLVTMAKVLLPRRLPHDHNQQSS